MEPSYSPLLGDDGRRLVDELRRFAREELDDPGLQERDAAGTFWDAGWRRCAAAGFCGLPAPPQFGGRGADRVTTAAALEALGYGCADAGLVFSLNAHLWSAVVPLWQFGSPEQQRRYLPGLCSGERIGLHAMTEPGSGSDAFALTTVAQRAGTGWVLNGQKTLITNAPHASVFIVFARSPGSEGALGVSAFLVDSSAEGVSVDEPTQKLGLRTALMAGINLREVQVEADAVLGREGRGARVFATSMEWERLLIMAGELGALARALQEATAYARERRQFGSPIAAFQAVSDKLIDAHVGLAAARALLYETALLLDRGHERAAGAAAAVKLFAAETSVRVALDLLQVHGGRGYTRELPFERRLRDAVGARIYSGTSELMRRIIARDLGL